MAVAAAGDAPETLARAAGGFGGDQAQVGHELAGVLENALFSHAIPFVGRSGEPGHRLRTEGVIGCLRFCLKLRFIAFASADPKRSGATLK